MKISLQPNPVKSGSYRILLQTGTRQPVESFLDYCERHSAVPQTDAATVLNLAARWLEEQAYQGQEIDLGPLGRSRLGMKGTFDALPRRIEEDDVELSVNWILPRALKAKVRTAGASLARTRVDPRPKAPEVLDARPISANAQLGERSRSYLPGRPLQIRGERLNFDTLREDEGVFILDLDGFEVMRVPSLISVTPKSLSIIVPEEVAGDCLLEVRRRQPEKTGKLHSGRLKIREA